MVQLILKNKSGFVNKNPNKPVIIRDFRNKLFYSTEGLRPVTYFSLPEGQYYIEKGDIELIPFKRPKLYRLPLPERNLKPPFNYNVIFDINPNKCTIQWRKKRIIFDNSLKDYTLPELYFILYHEFAHAIYTTEKYADLMAANLMLKKGYNPSQIGAAPITSLSNKQLYRKKYVAKNVIKNSKRKRKRKNRNNYFPLFLLPGI